MRRVKHVQLVEEVGSFDCFRFIPHLGGSRREGEHLDHGIEHHHDPVSSQANTSHLTIFILVNDSTQVQDDQETPRLRTQAQ